MPKQYQVEAIWDPDARVSFAKSNVPGLNVEAATIAQFIEVVSDAAPELISGNEPAPKRRAGSLRLKADLALAFA